MDKDYYKILEVDPKATQPEIKKQYRKMSLKFHPDHCSEPGANDKMVDLNEAYGILGDSKSRQEYDMMQQNPFLNMGHMNMGNMNMGNMSNMGNMGNMNMGNMNMGNMGNMNMGSINMSHLHNLFQEQDINEALNIFTQNLFGAGGGGGGIDDELDDSFPDIRNMTGNLHMFSQGSPRSQRCAKIKKPEPIHIIIDIPIYDAFHGKNVDVEYEKWTIINEKKIKEDVKQMVSIPPGIYSDETFTLKEQGNVINEDAKGDLVLTVNINNSTEFVRNKDDLHLKKKLTLKEALCGFEFDFDHVSGNNYTMRNDPLKGGDIISQNFKKIIPNMGMKRGDNVGNMIIDYDVIFPEQLDETQITALSEIL
jgi:DnaJ-class molecular chaperone